MKREEVLNEKCMDVIEKLENKNGDCNYFETVCAMKKVKLQGETLEEKISNFLFDYDYSTMFMTF
jgi:hypothetical protein